MSEKWIAPYDHGYDDQAASLEDGPSEQRDENEGSGADSAASGNERNGSAR